MKKNRTDELLLLLMNAPNDFLTINDLMLKLNISKRQIDNYVRNINKVVNIEMIIKKERGYLLIPNYRQYLHLLNNDLNNPKERISIIISHLLVSKEKLNVYDLADELFISKSTFDNDIKKVIKEIKGYDLTLEYNGDYILLKGNEKNKRKLTSHMIYQDSYAVFSKSIKEKFVGESYQQIDNLKAKLIHLFSKHKCYINDYSLNNIAMHLIVTIDRIKNDYLLHEKMPNFEGNDKQKSLVADLIQIIKEEFNVSISDVEYNNLLFFISCNMATIDYNQIDSTNINNFIPTEYIQFAQALITRIQEYYYLDYFSDPFITRFTLHIYNLFSRINNKYKINNPLSKEIKHAYPLVYDIAVFIANEIKKEYSISISEDEITFIAFHIGSFFENNNHLKNTISIAYVYRNYYDIYQKNIKTIEKQFTSMINIKNIISYHDFDPNYINCDLIISEVEMNIGEIVIPIFIKEEDITRIAYKINAISKEKEDQKFYTLLYQMIRPNLWHKNIKYTNNIEILNYEIDQLLTMNLIEDDFRQEIIDREELSCTAFDSGVAIPHSMSQNAKENFISILCYDHPILWKDKEVTLIILIGISYQNRKEFRFLFNKLIEVLSISLNVTQLSKTTSFENFTNELVHLIEYSNNT